MEDQSTPTSSDTNICSENERDINDSCNDLEEQEVSSPVEFSTEDEINLVTADTATATSPDLSNSGSNGNNQRLHCLDLLRGLIVAIMAWDHCKDFLSLYRGNDGTTPGGTDSWGKHTGAYAGELEMYSGKFQYFFARAISHICAPGFSFLMGVGMIMLKESRMKKSGWDKVRVCRFFVVRGMVLILLGFVVRAAFLIHPVPMHETKDIHPVMAVLLGFFQVMTSLGLSMITAAPFVTHALPCLSTTTATTIRTANISSVSEPEPSLVTPLLLPSIDDTPNSDVRQPNTPFKNIWIIWTICTLLASTILAIEQYLVWSRQGTDPGKAHMTDATTFGELLLRFTFVPGYFGSIPSLELYPFVPWLAITLFGIAFGASLVVHSSRRGQILKSYSALSGFTLLVAFVLVRFFGGRVFSTRGWPLHEGREYPLISFLNVCKYPPSVSYILLTMGINLLLLSGLSRIDHPNKCFLSRFLLIFGRVPLAFYVIHFYAITTIGVVIYVITGGVPGIPLPWVILLWLGLLVIMKDICAYYAVFKEKTSPESMWRFF